MFDTHRTTTHRDHDDLLSAGLGLEGLRSALPPAFADPEHPLASELRRRAIWSNWRGIADLASGRGFGTAYGSIVDVPGREYAAFATLPGALQPHRVLAQIPDGFDLRRRCVVVTASSGSRGIHGAIAVAGAWGLPKGFAVAATDKGCGTDFFDQDGKCGFDIDGNVAPRGTRLAFSPEAGGLGVATKHAHSRDNPEADWGRHVMQAAAFALQALDDAFPQAAPFTFDNTRVIAVGISNGGGAVLRAAEIDEGRLAAVVAGEPNVYVDGHGARCLYDYTTQALQWMPHALLHPTLGGLPVGAGIAALLDLRRAAVARDDPSDAPDGVRIETAYARLRALGWTVEALRAGALSAAFDLWRAIAVTYASSYGRYGAGEHPCGFSFGARNPDGTPRPALATERAAWWSDGSGIPPLVGADIVGGDVSGVSLCALWDGHDERAGRVRSGIAQTQCGLPRAGLPVVVLHGIDDGLVPMAFSSVPYVERARSAGRDVRFEAVARAQHFDAFLAMPEVGARYVPLLPRVHAALDRVLESF